MAIYNSMGAWGMFLDGCKLKNSKWSSRKGRSKPIKRKKKKKRDTHSHRSKMAKTKQGGFIVRKGGRGKTIETYKRRNGGGSLEVTRRRI